MKDKDRKQFEKWMLNNRRADHSVTERWDDGTYKNLMVQARSEAWQAALEAKQEVPREAIRKIVEDHANLYFDSQASVQEVIESAIQRYLEVTGPAPEGGERCKKCKCPAEDKVHDALFCASLGENSGYHAFEPVDSPSGDGAKKGKWAGFMEAVNPCGHTNAQHEYAQSGELVLEPCSLESSRPSGEPGLEAELSRLEMVLSPSGKGGVSGEYKRGWTNGKKHTINCLRNWITKATPASEREGK